jgi:hypothetical protein
MRSVIILMLLCGPCAVHSASAQAFESTPGLIGSLLVNTNNEGQQVLCSFLAKQENPRLVAIALDVTLGLFGMHRLYLGTDVKVPIGYTLTFGGGGVLWVADLIMLIATPDITPYMNNPHFFMWIPPAHQTK